MTRYIKDEQYAATKSVRSAAPGANLSLYMTRMDQLCTSAEAHLNTIHVSAILYGAAQICTAEEECHGGRVNPQVHGPDLQAFLLKMLTSLQLMIRDVDSRASRKILW